MIRAFLIAATLMVGITPAIAKPIPCWQVKAAVALTGSEEAAEKYALAHGYTAKQITTARRKCLKD